MATKKSRFSQPLIGLALAGEMITKEEEEACLKGNMALENVARLVESNATERQALFLKNLNSDIPGFPTGTRVEIFYLRGHYIKINRLMGLMDNGKPFPTNQC